MAIRLGKLKINRLWMLVAMAVVLSLLATWLSITYLRNREQAISVQLAEQAKGGRTVKVIVPTSDLAKGQPVTEGVVAGRDIQADLVYSDTLTVDDFGAIAGKPLLRPAQRGRPLTRADVIDDRPQAFSATLTPGMRAITVDIDELNSIAQMLKPGDFIDLNFITTDASTQGGQQIFPLLQHVKVIATGTRTGRMANEPTAADPGRRDPTQSYSTVTVEVTPEEAGYIALASQSGRIRTTLRSPEDNKIENYGPVTTALLTGGPVKPAGKGGASRMPVTAKVEYIVGGKAGGGAAAPMNINVSGLPGAGMPAPAAAGAGGVSVSGVPAPAQGAVNNAIAQANPAAYR